MRRVVKKHAPRRNQFGSKGKLALIEAPTFSKELGLVASWMNPVGQDDPAVITANIVSFAVF
jgi:hypothetical protein